MQIVMDRTGDSRHRFDPRDAQEVAKAERRFYELTNVGFAAAARTGPGQVSADPVVRSERGWSAANRAAAMLRFRTSRPGERSRRRATRALFIRHGIERTSEGRSLRLLRQWLSPLNGRSSRKRAISRSSAATPANATGSMREPRRTSARLMKTAVRRSGYVFCRWAICRSETSCCPRRSHWKAPRAAPWE